MEDQAVSFIAAHQGRYSVRRMCGLLAISVSSFYAACKREPSMREQDDAFLMSRICAVHATHRGVYGAPRVHRALRAEGICVGQKRVARLMQALRIVGVCRRRRGRRSVLADLRPAPDLVNRKFVAQRPNQLWVADITHIPTRTGKIYLAGVLDVWSRKIVGWAIAAHERTTLVAAALKMAVAARRPQRVVHHSDQGTQYTSLAFGQRCVDYGVQISMGSVGDCYDNAMCESFFATLECELLQRVPFTHAAMARHELIRYIEGFYNSRRLHSALGYQSPVCYERQALGAT